MRSHKGEGGWQSTCLPDLSMQTPPKDFIAIRIYCIFLFFKLFIRLCWVLAAAHEILVHLFLPCTDSLVMAHECRTVQLGIAVYQSSNPHALHGKAESQPLDHQESPCIFLFPAFSELWHPGHRCDR